MRRARAQEAESLTQIARAAKAHWGYPREWLALWREQLSVDANYVRTHPVLVATCADQLAGFAAIEPQADQCELAHFWIAPTFMRRGIGRTLFNAVLELEELQTCRTLRILSDPHALEFYLAMGCVQTGSAPSDIAGRALPVLEHKL
ncbi:MAG: GNAT family N-acetyltransferase [Gammaproteobacteria bacterium]|nr:GNAT family N-acetyltransferase [Gammaproteobacteria bacterium]